MINMDKNTATAKQNMKQMSNVLLDMSQHIDAFNAELLKSYTFSLENSLQALTKAIDFAIITKGETGGEPILRVEGSETDIVNKELDE